MSIQRCCPPASVDVADRTADAALLKALADPHRLTMVATLAPTIGPTVGAKPVRTLTAWDLDAMYAGMADK